MNVVLRGAACALWCVVVGVAQHDRAASRPYDAALAAAGVTAESAPALIVAAKAAFEAGDARLAAALLDVAATQTPDSRPVKLDAARARLAAGEPAVALSAAEELLAAAPSDVDAAVLRAQALVDLGEGAHARDAVAALQGAGLLPAAARPAYVELEAAYGDPLKAENAARVDGAPDVAALGAVRAAYARRGEWSAVLRLASESAVLIRKSTQAGVPPRRGTEAAVRRDYVRAAVELRYDVLLDFVDRGLFKRPEVRDEETEEDVALMVAAERTRRGDAAARAARLADALRWRPASPSLRIAAAEASAQAGNVLQALGILAEGFSVVSDAEPLRAAFDRLTAPPVATDSAAETAFSLGPAGLRTGDETLPLGAPGSSVRLRQLRVAAGSPRAALTIAAGHLSAEDLRRALDALAGAGFSRVRFP